MSQAEEILALQIAEDPDFLTKREVLWAAVLDAQSKIKMGPDYDRLAQNLFDAQNAYSAQGSKWVTYVHCGNATKGAALAAANLQAAQDLKSERHAEVNKESMRKSRGNNG